MINRRHGLGSTIRLSTYASNLHYRKNTKGRLAERPTSSIALSLERGLNLEAPSFQKRLRDVLRVLVAACPLPQTSRPQILVGRKLVLPHNLLKFSDRRGDRSDRLRLTPVWISASLRHELLPFHSGEYELQKNFLNIRFSSVA